MSTARPCPMLLSAALSRICAPWLPRTSSRPDRALSAGRRTRLLWMRSQPRETAPGPRKSLKSCTSPHGRRLRTEAALTLHGGRVVNPICRKPTAWTWTRGGWRDRYPEDLPHAWRKPAWGNCDRIRAHCRPHRHSDDERTAVAWRRRRWDVG